MMKSFTHYFNVLGRMTEWTAQLGNRTDAASIPPSHYHYNTALSLRMLIISDN